MGLLTEELAKVLLRKRRSYRFTQSDLGQRIGVSGSYISSLETAKASPRISELEDMAAHFRTTALALILDASNAGEGYIPATEARPDGLDAIVADLQPDSQRLAREFILFLRERERVDRSVG
jgi:transcriptional regulator with XRE-family HTH domain